MSNMVVRTNVFSLNAHRNMKNVGLEQKRASNRLSSGYRINSAADDAAGLAISETMRAQIRGLDQASRNAQDGQAMLLTTEGGLDEIGNMLQRVRELLVQASNDTNTQDQRVMIEQEVRQLAQEVASMQQRVEFNTNRVLAMGPSMVSSVAGEMALIQEDMNALSDAFSIVNANLAEVAVAREILSSLPPLASFETLNQGQTRAVTDALRAVGFSDVALFVSSNMAGTPLLSLNAPKLGAETVDNELNLTQVISLLDQRRNDLDAVTRELNDHIGNLHNHAQATFRNIEDFAAFRAVGGVSERAATIYQPPGTTNGWEWVGATVADRFTVVDGTAAVSALALASGASVTTALANVLGAATENASAVHGVNRFRTTAVGDGSSYIWVVQTGTNWLTDQANAANTTITIKDAYSGAETMYRVSGNNLMSMALVTGHTFTAGEVGGAPTATAGSSHQNVALATGGVYMGSWVFRGAAVAAREASEGMAAGSTGNNVAFFQVGANANQGITFDFETVSRAVTAAASNVTMVATLLSNPDAGSGIGRGISVTPLISAIQSSLDDVNNIRANLGAVQNRMDYTMRSLDISSENLQDSESRVRNADIAREMMRFTMANVLQQASVSMLAQANQLPNNLLQLLR